MPPLLKYKIELFSRNSGYRAPAYVKLAAKRKCNRNDIFILGVPYDELHAFWAGVSYRAVKFTRPVEKGRAVVDIDSRCHANTADFTTDVDLGDLDGEACGEEKPDDWFDEFAITSKKDEGRTRSKSYQLELSKSTTTGGSFNLQLSGAGFFNTVAPSAGISGTYSKTNGTTWTTRGETSESLSQGYEIVDTLKIPPKTKVKATITTYAVTYESKTLTEVRVYANSSLTIRYRKRFSRKILGGIIVHTLKVTAKELFRNELDYKCEDDVVTFKRWGAISHLGEEVEILKERDPCTKEEELNRESVPITL